MTGQVATPGNPAAADAGGEPARPARGLRDRRPRDRSRASGAAALPPGAEPDPAPTTRGPTERERLGAMVGLPVDASDVARWRADVDTLAEHGQTLVRTGIYAWKVAAEAGALGPGDGRVLPRAARLRAAARPGRQPGGSRARPTGRSPTASTTTRRPAPGSGRRCGRASATRSSSGRRSTKPITRTTSASRRPPGTRPTCGSSLQLLGAGAGDARPRRRAGDHQPDGVAAERRARAGVVPGPRRDRRLARRDQHRPVPGRQRDTRSAVLAERMKRVRAALRQADLRGRDRVADHARLVDRVRPAALRHRGDRATADRRAVGHLPCTSSGTTRLRGRFRHHQTLTAAEKLGFRRRHARARSPMMRRTIADSGHRLESPVGDRADVARSTALRRSTRWGAFCQLYVLAVAGAAVAVASRFRNFLDEKFTLDAIWIQATLQHPRRQPRPRRSVPQHRARLPGARPGRRARCRRDGRHRGVRRRRPSRPSAGASCPA